MLELVDAAMASQDFTSDLPPQFAALKEEIADSIPDFESKATRAWGEIIAELATVTEEVTKKGSSVCLLLCSASACPLY